MRPLMERIMDAKTDKMNNYENPDTLCINGRDYWRLIKELSKGGEFSRLYNVYVKVMWFSGAGYFYGMKIKINHGLNDGVFLMYNKGRN